MDFLDPDVVSFGLPEFLYGVGGSVKPTYLTHASSDSGWPDWRLTHVVLRSAPGPVCRSGRPLGGPS